jgi:hypothetical protein
MEENHLLLYILSTRQIYLQSYSILFNFILFKLYILNWYTIYHEPWETKNNSRQA